MNHFPPGLNTKVSWATFSNGAIMNDALLAGQVEIASGGIPPFVVLWARTRGTPNEVGHIKVAPQSWKDLFFPEVHDLPGS